MQERSCSGILITTGVLSECHNLLKRGLFIKSKMEIVLKLVKKNQLLVVTGKLSKMYKMTKCLLIKKILQVYQERMLLEIMK